MDTREELSCVFLSLTAGALDLQRGHVIEDGTGIYLFTGTKEECRVYVRRGETYTAGGARVWPVLGLWSNTAGAFVVVESDLGRVAA